MRPEQLLYPAPEGLFCPIGGFYIDPVQPVERALITHGHSDHARSGHAHVLATRQTLDIMRIRYGAEFAGSEQAADFGEEVTINGVKVSFHPAGHVLGSAQIAVEKDGLRIVVSGDYKRRPDPTCAAYVPVPCDVFITEATFGLPVFHHPDPMAETRKLLASLRQFPERTHMIGAYALGKAQRVIRLLRDAGYDKPIYIHGALETLCDYYISQGIALGELRPATVESRDQSIFHGAVVVGPPSAFQDRWARRFHDPLPAFASGWMMVRQRAKQLGVELPLVISDHCDWPELTETISELKPAEVWVTHGREEALVRWCELQGIAAKPLHLIGYEDEGRLMKAFADLLDRLVLTPSRNGKLKLLTDYFRDTPDPDRGYGLAAIAGTLEVRNVKPAMLRELVLERMDEVLFRYSYDYVGDLAETISLVWDKESDIERSPAEQPRLGEVIGRMNALGRTEVRGFVRDLLDKLDTSGRFAFLKLATGALRIGVSARLAKQALAELSGKDVTEIETLWHGLQPPYESLFQWLEGRGERPVLATPAIFHSVMLANPVEPGDLDGLDPRDFAAEWKWDGIRVQLSRSGSTSKLYSRSGDDISGAFPDIVDAMSFEGVMDGELLVGGTVRSNSATRSFSDLQQRLNRKTVTAKMLEEFPAFIRAYDLLFDREKDVRGRGFLDRRQRLTEIVETAPHDRFDLSPLVDFTSWDELDRLRSSPPDPVIEGVMIKRRDSAYLAGRAKGPWFKWKRDPYNVDAVLMYAQRGHGKRSSYYSDFTFGVWSMTPEGEQLVPVGKAYFGFTDAELEVLDKFVRNNTVDRFGPVRAVRADRDFGFVLEVAFEGINRSTRHKSGVAMRFPRIARLRPDKPPYEADRLETLIALIDAKAPAVDE